MSVDKKWGVAVVGLRMGNGCCDWVVNQSPNCKLAAVCDVNDERLKKSCTQWNVPGEKSFDDLLKRKDVEIVYIVTPSGLHGELGMKAAKAGKHVLVTKPMDVTLEACDALIQTCEKNSVLCAVDFCGRYADTTQKIRHAIDNNLFGKLILGEGRLKWFRSEEYYAASGWRGTWKMDGGGALANQTIHYIDQIQWLMGPVASVVAADFGTFTHKIETEDLGVAMLRFKNGALGTILGTTTCPKDFYCGVEIHGTDGGVIGMEGDPKFLFKDEARLTQLKRATEYKTTVDNLAGVLNGTSKHPLCDGKEGRKAVEILTAIYRSAKEHREVKLPL